MTFTERAAQQLQQRLRAKLLQLFNHEEDVPGEDRWLLDSVAKSRLQEALNRFESASVCTIHAFCRRALARHDPGRASSKSPEVIDGRRAFQEALRRALRTHLAKRPEEQHYLRLWLADRSLGALENLLLECYERRATLSPKLCSDTLHKALGAVRALDLSPRALRPWLSRSGLSSKDQRALLERLLWLRRLVLEQTPDEPELIATLSKEQKLGELLAKVEGLARPGRKVPLLCQTIRALQDATPSFEAVIAQRFGPIVEREVQAQKAAQDQMDYDDMILRLQALLTGPQSDSVKRSIRERYRFALIDEFQDTDQRQWSIFEQLFAEDGHLYVIGDPKQAIYSFRGADVQTYLRAKTRLSERAPVEHLDACFRASTPMIQALNTLLEDGVPERFFTGPIRYTHPVRPGRPRFAGLEKEGTLLSPVHLFQLPKSGAKEAHLRAIVREAWRLLRPGAFCTREGLERTPLSARDILVLTRTTDEGSELAARLKAAGLPVQFHHKTDLFQTPQAQDVLTLLLAIERPEDPARRAAAWLSPFFDVPLYQLSNARELPGTHPLLKRLFAWRGKAERNLRSLLSAIHQQSGLWEREALLGDPSGPLRNYQRILEILEEQCATEVFSLGELIERMRALIQGEVQASEYPHAARGEEDAIQLMTMHRAKGLEAAVVFLYGGLQSPKQSSYLFHRDGQRLQHVGPNPPTQALQEQREEEQRLLYVAITRAKARIYLPQLPAAQRLQGPYRELNRVLLSPRLLASSKLFQVEALSASSPAVDRAAPERPLSAWSPPAALLEPPQAAPPALPDALLTEYAHLPWEAGGAKLPEVELSSELGAPKSEAERTEQLIRELLCTLPLQNLEEPQKLRALIQAELSARSLDPSLSELCAQRLQRALSAPLRLGELLLPQGLRKERIKRAVDYLYPLPATSPTMPWSMIKGRGFLRGTIDVLLEKEGKLFVLDWRPRLPKTQPAHARFYALLLKRMYSWQDEASFQSFGGVAFVCAQSLDAQLHRPAWSESLEAQVNLLPQAERLALLERLSP